jgi:uncharacterized protein (TIGR00730 family)
MQFAAPMADAVRPVKSVCVYCGSQDGRDPAHAAAARAMGDALVDRGMRLVYGGGGIGMMGQIADQVLARGGEVIGVIPEALMRAEVAHQGVTEMHVTKGMHDRKALMADLADAFVTMPGGLGTLEELFETWTWAQLRYHDKPIGLLNVNGYFDGLLQWLDQAVADGYVRGPHRGMLHVDTVPERLLSKLR